MIPQTTPEMSRTSADVLNVQQHLKFITNPCNKVRDRKTVIFYIQLQYSYKMEIRSLNYGSTEVREGFHQHGVCLGMTRNQTLTWLFLEGKDGRMLLCEGRQEQRSQEAVLHFPEPLHINDQNFHSLFTESISVTHQFGCVAGNLLFMICFCDH